MDTYAFVVVFIRLDDDNEAHCVAFDCNHVVSQNRMAAFDAHPVVFLRDGPDNEAHADAPIDPIHVQEGAMKGDLLREVRDALSLNQRTLAELLQISSRTVQRWVAGKSSPHSHDWQAMARAVQPVDPELAERLAGKGGTSLTELGLVRAPPVEVAPPPPPPRPPDHELRHLADAVVCAAAESMGVTPGAIRAALLAAFRRARQMRLTTEDMERALLAAGEAGKISPDSRLDAETAGAHVAARMG